MNESLDILLKYIKENLDKKQKDIDLSNPINLYITQKQADIYLDAINSKQFQGQLHFPIKQLISKNLDSILEFTTDKVDVIDLGPGLPDKTASILEYIISYKELLRYIPVDINSAFLKLSEDYFKLKNITIHPINCLFSDLPNRIKHDELFKNDHSRFFILGLTFNNFCIQDMKTLFSNLLDNRSVGLIATEFLDETSIEKVIEPYKTLKAKTFNFQMLAELGLNINSFKYLVDFNNSKIEMSFINESVCKLPDGSIIPKGIKFLTSISYRYTLEYLKNQISNDLDIVNIYKNGKSKISLMTLKNKKLC